MRRIGLRERVLELERALVRAAKEAAWETLGSEEGIRGSFEMQLRCLVEPGNPWRISCSFDLEQQIRDALRELTVRLEVLKQGRVYCYRCESSCCQHSIPPSCGTVFGGYGPTGFPRWVEFQQLLLEVRHPRLEELFHGEGKEVLAVYSDGPSLKKAQLEVFGRMSRAYDILGQVAFGFVCMGKERVALTAQAVEVRGLNGQPRVELNLLGQAPGEAGPWEALEFHYHGRIVDLLKEARRKIQLLGVKAVHGRPSKGARGTPGTGSERILKNLARGLEKIGRQARRRTTHAEMRRGDLRPTYKAWEDATAAPPERILWDARRKTVVVLGPRQRVHVFSRAGKHVTSLILDGEAVENRIRKKRWVVPDAELVKSFKFAMAEAGREAWGSCPEPSLRDLEGIP